MVIISEEDCKKWLSDPTRNPVTNRTIAPTGQVYKNLKKHCDPTPGVAGAGKLGAQHCDIWRKDPSRNPLTNRKLNVAAKNGVYAQLAKICASVATKKTSSARVSVSVKQTSVISESRANNRIRLINAVKKHIQPILHKADTLDARVKFAHIVRKYLADLQPCLNESGGKLALETKQQKYVVTFDKRIGSMSAFGVAYLNSGAGFAKLLKFSCKLMSASIKGNIQEVKLLDKMSMLAETGKTPNMPITYTVLKCNKICNLPQTLCPAVTKMKSYFVVINELADEDLTSWFKRKHSDEEYESILFQLLVAIYSFHSLGYSHNDCHFGNFLVHNIKPGGYWHYKLANYDIYIPNAGYLLVMWDPGMAAPLDTNNYLVDYVRAIVLAVSVNRVYAGTYPLSNSILLDLGLPLLHIFSTKIVASTDLTRMTSILYLMENQNTLLPNYTIVHNDQSKIPRPKSLLNKTPYVL